MNTIALEIANQQHSTLWQGKHVKLQPRNSAAALSHGISAEIEHCGTCWALEDVSIILNVISIEHLAGPSEGQWSTVIPEVAFSADCQRLAY